MKKCIDRYEETFDVYKLFFVLEMMNEVLIIFFSASFIAKFVFFIFF